jgi:hypothetical protein
MRDQAPVFTWTKRRTKQSAREACFCLSRKNIM